MAEHQVSAESIDFQAPPSSIEIHPMEMEEVANKLRRAAALAEALEQATLVDDQPAHLVHNVALTIEEFINEALASLNKFDEQFHEKRKQVKSESLNPIEEPSPEMDLH